MSLNGYGTAILLYVTVPAFQHLGLKSLFVKGRNRQVRHMTSAVGFPTLRLIRTKIGTIDLFNWDYNRAKPKEIEPLLCRL